MNIIRNLSYDEQLANNLRQLIINNDMTENQIKALLDKDQITLKEYLYIIYGSEFTKPKNEQKPF